MHSALRFAQALADGTRLRILVLLRDEALCVCELADILRMPQSSLSSHLQVIRRGGLLESERREKWIYYRVAASAQPLLGTFFDSFDAELRESGPLRRDAARARLRLNRRATSCCPGPLRLASAAPSTPPARRVPKPSPLP